MGFLPRAFLDGAAEGLGGKLHGNRKDEIHGRDHAEHSGDAVQVEHLARQHLGHGAANRAQRQQEGGSQRTNARGVELGRKDPDGGVERQHAELEQRMRSAQREREQLMQSIQWMIGGAKVRG